LGAEYSPAPHTSVTVVVAVVVVVLVLLLAEKHRFTQDAHVFFLAE